MTPLAALDKAEAALWSSVMRGMDSPEAREALRAIREARAEILRQAVREADVSCQCPECDEARTTLGLKA